MVSPRGLTGKLVQLSDAHLPFLGGRWPEVAQWCAARLETERRKGGVAQLVSVCDHGSRCLHARGNSAGGRDLWESMFLNAGCELRSRLLGSEHTRFCGDVWGFSQLRNLLHSASC